MESIRRFFRLPETGCFLFGPRGTGKSTWLRSLLPEAVWIDLLDPEMHRALVARPERLRELIAGSPAARDVVVDEVQKAPALLDVVHALVEEGGSPRFVLTGSSARKLRRGGANLLAGRLLETSLHPFMAAELGREFTLERALQVGLVPLVWGAADPAATLRTYISLYLREEVQAEALVRDVGAFARFLEAVALSHGTTINLAAVARECQVGRKTVEGYMGIVEDLLLAFRVPVFARRAKRQLVAHEKFYLFDAGVYRSLRRTGPLDGPEEVAGAALEGLVAQHLRAWIAYRGGDARLHYWRTKSGTEVDFVVYGGEEFHAIEVKHSRTVHRVDLRGLRTFREDYPEATPLMLYGGRERLVIDGIACIPCEDFLRGLRPDASLAEATGAGRP